MLGNVWHTTDDQDFLKDYSKYSSTSRKRKNHYSLSYGPTLKTPCKMLFITRNAFIAHVLNDNDGVSRIFISLGQSSNLGLIWQTFTLKISKLVQWLRVIMFMIVWILETFSCELGLNIHIYFLNKDRNVRIKNKIHGELGKW